MSFSVFNGRAEKSLGLGVSFSILYEGEVVARLTVDEFLSDNIFIEPKREGIAISFGNGQTIVTESKEVVSQSFSIHYMGKAVRVNYLPDEQLISE